MGDFTVPDKHQRELMERNGISPDGLTVILENDSILCMKKHITGDEVIISKGERTRRLEKNGHQ